VCNLSAVSIDESCFGSNLIEPPPEAYLGVVFAPSLDFQESPIRLEAKAIGPKPTLISLTGYNIMADR
jgi:hypothetical protein